MGAFEWMENFGFVVSMVVQEPKYFLIVIPAIGLLVLFFILLKRIFKSYSNLLPIKLSYNIPLLIVFLGLLFLGIRGRIQKKSPIRVGTAYFSDNAFLNRLGLNPTFTLLRSYLDSQNPRNNVISFLDNEIASANVRSYFNIKTTEYSSPIARKIASDSILQPKPNVVLIIMESMSAHKMGRHGNPYGLTPYLDSLSHNSLYFENCYTAGKHTFNGVFSSLFSFPALYRQHTMKNMRQYDGMSKILLNNGYSTTYFTTHDSQFDNIEGFLRANCFQNIISQADYPQSEVKTTLGVPDDYMFRHSIPVLNELAAKNKPFFTTFMTTSDHGPYYIPEYFTPKSKDIKKQIVTYADWSIQQFMKMASKESWYDNTLFVFVADHGAPLQANYDISLSYFHSPLIFYSANGIQTNAVRSEISSQLDVFPTTMGLLRIPYVNNTLGLDLLKSNRPHVMVNDDDKIGILDTTFLCIMKNNGAELALYKYRQEDRTNYYTQYPEKAKEMADYAKSSMQVTQSMILRSETSVSKNNSQ